MEQVGERRQEYAVGGFRPRSSHSVDVEGYYSGGPLVRS
jgi:hypothetical protein